MEVISRIHANFFSSCIHAENMANHAITQTYGGLHLPPSLPIAMKKQQSITCIVHYSALHCHLEFFQVLTALFHNKSDQRPDICSVAQPTAAQH